jgi:hypothetical protein
MYSETRAYAVCFVKIVWDCVSELLFWLVYIRVHCIKQNESLSFSVYVVRQYEIIDIVESIVKSTQQAFPEVPMFAAPSLVTCSK